MSRARARPRHVPGFMNNTEQRFLKHVIEPLMAAGAVRHYYFERLKFRFGVDWKATYTPDFVLVLENYEFECIDVKGPAGWEEHTLQKMKACANFYPDLAWVGYHERKGERGVFDREEFN